MRLHLNSLSGIFDFEIPITAYSVFLQVQSYFFLFFSDSQPDCCINCLEEHESRCERRERYCPNTDCLSHQKVRSSSIEKSSIGCKNSYKNSSRKSAYAMYSRSSYRIVNFKHFLYKFYPQYNQNT